MASTSVAMLADRRGTRHATRPTRAAPLRCELSDLSIAAISSRGSFSQLLSFFTRKVLTAAKKAKKDTLVLRKHH
jgi:hypothetical protein